MHEDELNTLSDGKLTITIALGGTVDQAAWKALAEQVVWRDTP